MALLAVAPPIPPDFYVCDRTWYGGPPIEACRTAANLLPSGSDPVSFAVQGHEGGRALPRIHHGEFPLLGEIALIQCSVLISLL